MTYNVFSGTLNPTHFTSLHFLLVICSNSVSVLHHVWATVTSNCLPYAMGPLSSVCLVCNVGVFWPNGWIYQDATWCGGRPRVRQQCVRWGPSSPDGKGHSTPHFLTHLALARSPISATAELLFQDIITSAVYVTARLEKSFSFDKAVEFTNITCFSAHV